MAATTRQIVLSKIAGDRTLMFIKNLGLKPRRSTTALIGL
jgi:hypothetical protein